MSSDIIDIIDSSFIHIEGNIYKLKVYDFIFMLFPKEYRCIVNKISGDNSFDLLAKRNNKKYSWEYSNTKIHDIVNEIIHSIDEFYKHIEDNLYEYNEIENSYHYIEHDELYNDIDEDND